MQAAIDAVEQNETAVAELETLNTTHAATLQEVEDLKALNLTQKQKLVELEADLTKLNGSGTTVDGPEGREDPDTNIADPEKRALMNDLKSLRGELTNVHS